MSTLKTNDLMLQLDIGITNIPHWFSKLSTNCYACVDPSFPTEPQKVFNLSDNLALHRRPANQHLTPLLFKNQ